MKTDETPLYTAWTIITNDKYKIQILKSKYKFGLSIIGPRGGWNGTVGLTKENIESLVHDLLEACGPWDET